MRFPVGPLVRAFRRPFWRPFWLLAATFPVWGWTADWPQSPKLSGNAFLPPGLMQLQADSLNSPVALWLDRGAAQWIDSSTGPSCQSCHGSVDNLKASAGTFPRLSAKPQAKGSTLINLEDQIAACSSRDGRIAARVEEDNLLALSALLNNAAKGLAIDVKAPPGENSAWQIHLNRGAQLFSTRLGRINLACVHCHDQNVGRQMRLDVISPGNPTGFPIYRMSWQRLGSIERRLRACYSGVQAVLPPPGHTDLRDLELFLKVRANGLPQDGPSIRR